VSAWTRAGVRSAGALSVLLLSAAVSAQETPTSPPLQLAQPEGTAAAPVVITLADALERARMVDATFQASAADAAVAREERVQAKSSTLPALSHTTQYLGTQSNDVLPSGRFVTNDGVHVFRSWAVVHQEVSAKTVLQAPYRRAQAAEVLAEARRDVAERGLTVTVTRSYYAF